MSTSSRRIVIAIGDRSVRHPLNDDAAVQVLRDRLPEFAAEIDEHIDTYGELLFHLLMSDLARFYVSSAADEPEAQRRFWMTVDWLQMYGDERVQNAIAVSLIEWFAWGDERQRRLLVDAKSQMSTAVRAIVDELLRAGGYAGDGRALES